MGRQVLSAVMMVMCSAALASEKPCRACLDQDVREPRSEEPREAVEEAL